jgi:hypothetical protein
MYSSSPNGNLPGEPQGPKAPQACMSCRKQKRKCSKTLPACALCTRMNRHCDYSDASPPPTSEDFHALQMKVMELEARWSGAGGATSQPSPYPTPSSSALAGSEGLAQVPVYSPAQDIPWQGVQNRFPAIAFLDSESFKYGGYVWFKAMNDSMLIYFRINVPKPSVDIPVVSLYLYTNSNNSADTDRMFLKYSEMDLLFKRPSATTFRLFISGCQLFPKSD